VLKVRKLRGGRTPLAPEGSPGPKAKPLTGGGRPGRRHPLLLSSAEERARQGSKVMVRYLVKDGKKTRPTLRVQSCLPTPPLGRGAAPAAACPIGDATFSITFPNTPDESKTDLGTLYRYDYKFSKSYHPDTYYFFRTNADGNGTPKFFRDQASASSPSPAATSGGEDGPREAGQEDAAEELPRAPDSRDRILAPGRCHPALVRRQEEGRLRRLGPRLLANQLAANEDMRREFFGSFSLK